jgi:hypothetical protein
MDTPLLCCAGVHTNLSSWSKLWWQAWSSAACNGTVTLSGCSGGTSMSHMQVEGHGAAVRMSKWSQQMMLFLSKSWAVK